MGHRHPDRKPFIWPDARAVTLSTANLEARRAYFRALEEHWPEVLDGLVRDVLPLYEPRWHTEAKLRFLVIDRWEYFQQGTERKNLRDALQKWAAKFRITEAWILDAALETLLIYCPQVQPTTNAPREKGSVRFWRIPLDFHPVFTPAFDRAVWYPPQRGWWERWESFKSRMQHQFSSKRPSRVLAGA